MKKDCSRNYIVDSKWTMMIVLFLVFLLVCGSLWDYEISEFIYVGDLPSENMFGVLFSYLGPIPCFIGWSFFAASILNISKKDFVDEKKRKRLKYLAYVLYFLSIVAYPTTILFVNESVFSLSPLIAIPFGLIIVWLGAYLGHKLSDTIDDPEVLKAILMLIALSFVLVIFVTFAKQVMNRPRFRWVMNEEYRQYFIHWWENGIHIKDVYYTGLMDDEFTSFPSGHSAYSIFAMFVLPLIAEYNVTFKKYKMPLFIAGVLFWFLTSFSRLTVGAHFISDIAFSGLAVILFYYLMIFVKRLCTSMKGRV